LKKSIFCFLLMPFIVNAFETGSIAEANYHELMSLRKANIDTARILKEVPAEIKIEILNLVESDIQNPGDIEVVDLRSLETDLRASIHDTIGSGN
jgi:hypothetical protein